MWPSKELATCSGCHPAFAPYDPRDPEFRNKRVIERDACLYTILCYCFLILTVIQISVKHKQHKT